MILFDLRCARGHVFEAWFGSSADYDDQHARKLIACPLCNDTQVEKAVMAPAIATKSNQQGDTPPSLAAIDPAEVKAIMAAMAGLQANIVKSHEYVGDRFVDEVRAIHYGERDAREIYGEATLEEAEALREEGIELMPLQFLPRPITDA